MHFSLNSLVYRVLQCTMNSLVYMVLQCTTTKILNMSVYRLDNIMQIVQILRLIYSLFLSNHLKSVNSHKWFNYSLSLCCCVIYLWRLESHTFHLTIARQSLPLTCNFKIVNTAFMLTPLKLKKECPFSLGLRDLESICW